MSKDKKDNLVPHKDWKIQINRLARDKDSGSSKKAITEIGLSNPEAAAYAFEHLMKGLDSKSTGQSYITGIGRLGFQYPEFQEKAFEVLKANEDVKVFEAISASLHKDWERLSLFIDVLASANNEASIKTLIDVARWNPITEKAFNALCDMLPLQDNEPLKSDIKTGLYDIARTKGSEFAKRVIDMLIEQDFPLPSGDTAAGSVRYLASFYKRDNENLAEYAIDSLSRSQSPLAAKTIAAISGDTDSSRPAAIKALEKMATPDSVAALAKMVGDDWDRAIETLPVLMRLSDKFNEKADQEAVITSLKSVMNIAINPSKLAPAIYDYSTAAIDKLKSEFMAAGNRAEPHPFIINVIFSSVLEANDFRKRASLADQQAAQVFGLGLEK